MSESGRSKHAFQSFNSFRCSFTHNVVIVVVVVVSGGCKKLLPQMAYFLTPPLPYSDRFLFLSKSPPALELDPGHLMSEVRRRSPPPTPIEQRPVRPFGDGPRRQLRNNCGSSHTLIVSESGWQTGRRLTLSTEQQESRFRNNKLVRRVEAERERCRWP